MNFLWCTLQVADMEASLAFYTTITGLEINAKLSPGEDIEIVFLGKGDTQVELFCNKKYERKAPCEGISMGFETPNLDDTMNFIHSKGIKIHSGPFSPNPHTRFFYVQDPDGYMVQFVENK